MRRWVDLLQTRVEGWTVLVRLMVGLIVFFPEGIQKLIFPEILGAGRFANIGIPYPELMGAFVGVVEVTCGALIILGFLIRLAAVPLMVIMVVAIVSTKLPIWAGHDLWIFHAPKIARYGFWSMAHEPRLPCISRGRSRSARWCCSWRFFSDCRPSPQQAPTTS